MARLPVDGGDQGAWANILNTYLDNFTSVDGNGNVVLALTSALTHTLAGTMAGTYTLGGTPTFGAASTVTADMTFNDNINATFGTGGDADIRYNATDLLILPAVVGTGDVRINGGSLRTQDNEGVWFGTGDDARMYHDDTNTIINPMVVGSGAVNIVTDNVRRCLILTNSGGGTRGVVLNSLQDSGLNAVDGDSVFEFSMFADDDTGAERQVGRFEVLFADVTSTTLDSSWGFATMNNVNAGNINTTATLTSAGVWTDAASFGELKTYEDLSPAAVLSALKGLKVGRYRGVGRANVAETERHIGPTADEFYNAFKAGKNPRVMRRGNDGTEHPQYGIAAHDMAGVALMAIQELIPRIEALEAAR